MAKLLSPKLQLNWDQYLELEKLGLNVFAPLEGFMGEEDFWACIEKGRLSRGDVFTIPIVLDILEKTFEAVATEKAIELYYEDSHVGTLTDPEFYRPDLARAAQKLFTTLSEDHPGARAFLRQNPVFVGGKIKLIKRIPSEYSRFEYTPKETRDYFQKQGWKTVVGFQTRNAPHRAHEYLQKAALELCDGILIQPLVGRKKSGDYTPESVFAGYSALIENYFPLNRVLLSGLTTHMRYAGPREAAFHALVRRNYGCTHFIVGRDHAGVGGFYDKYAAHRFIQTFDDLGINVLLMRGPYFCVKCDSMATDKTCPHGDDHPEYALSISGTQMRAMLGQGAEIDTRMMRVEVVESLRKVKDVFVK